MRGSLLVAAASGGSTHYELLGIEPDADEGEIKAAFRRMALDLHPDVNDEPDAHQAFIDLKEAYETLSDGDSRREYDRMHGLGRRLGFFQDVDPQDSLRGWRSRGRSSDSDDEEDGEDYGYIPRARPFRWADVGCEPESAGRPGDGFNAGDEEDRDGDGDDEDEAHRDFEAAERLRRLMQFMDGHGAGGLWGGRGGGGNPWGSSTSDAWHRQVTQQVNDPRFGGGTGRGRGGAPDPSRPTHPSEWNPPGWAPGDDDGFDFGDGARRRHGWSSPGGRPEWRPPGRGEDGGREGGGGGGERRRSWGNDGGFRGKPL
ncbi:hypothetical protein FOA52_013334 [Chlamydomonas sp. UWO 241]|nr:hypothetical protein FOA52_013334 [Chlamydomonas sp. UWO 241]